MRLADGSWRTIGAAARLGNGITPEPGLQICGVDGATVVYTRADPFLPWLEETTGVDLTPCWDPDGGDASRSSDCGSFPREIHRVYGSWENGCRGGPLSEGVGSCEPFDGPFDPDPNTPDDSPTDPPDDSETTTGGDDSTSGDPTGGSTSSGEMTGGSTGSAGAQGDSWGTADAASGDGATSGTPSSSGGTGSEPNEDSGGAAGSTDESSGSGGCAVVGSRTPLGLLFVLLFLRRRGLCVASSGGEGG